MKRFLALPLALVITTAAWAHNGMDHILGTVSKVAGSSMDVKSRDGKLITVSLDAKTMWMRGKAMITAADVHEGERVVIHAKKVDGKYMASEVELGDATEAAHKH